METVAFALKDCSTNFAAICNSLLKLMLFPWQENFADKITNCNSWKWWKTSCHFGWTTGTILCFQNSTLSVQKETSHNERRNKRISFYAQHLNYCLCTRLNAIKNPLMNHRSLRSKLLEWSFPLTSDWFSMKTDKGTKTNYYILWASCDIF